MKVVVTCEHGGNRVPKRYLKYITDAGINNTHRAYDAGAYDLYQAISGSFADFRRSSGISRLLIDFNRSLNNRNIFSVYSRNIPEIDLLKLVDLYKKYRESVTGFINFSIKRKSTVFHLSIHTFVPELDGIKRHNDIGILFDPKIKEEKSVASKWKSIMSDINPEYKIRLNYPYLGISDGFTTHLRKLFATGYIGIELEVNQKHVVKNRIKPEIKETIVQSLRNLIGNYQL